MESATILTHFKTDYHLMQVKSIAECSKGIKTFVLSIFEWLYYAGFPVSSKNCCPNFRQEHRIFFLTFY